MPSAAVSVMTSSAFDARPQGGAAAPPAPNAQPAAAKPAPGAATAKAGKAAKRVGDPEPFAKALSRAAEGGEPSAPRAPAEDRPATPTDAAPAVEPTSDGLDEQPSGEVASTEAATPDAAGDPIETGTGGEKPEISGEAAETAAVPVEAATEEAPAQQIGIAAHVEVEVPIPAQPVPVASDREMGEIKDAAEAKVASEAVPAPKADGKTSDASEGARASAVRAIPSPELAQAAGSTAGRTPAKAARQTVEAATEEPSDAAVEPLPKGRAEGLSPVAAPALAAPDQAGDEGSSTESGEEGKAQQRDAASEAVASGTDGAESAPRAQAPARKVAPDRDAHREPGVGQVAGASQAQPAAGAPDAGAKGAPSSVFTFEGLRVGGVAVGVGGPHAAQGASPQARAVPAESDLSQSAFEATVSRGLGVAVNQRGGAVTIRLQPESLGAMRIHLEIEQGLVQGRFEVATPEARDLLSKSMDTLRTALESRGLSVERLQVHLASPNEGSTGRGTQDQGERQGAGARQDAADGRSRGSFEQGGGPGGREREGQPRSGGFEEVWGLAGAERPAEPLGLPPWSGAGRLAVDAVG